LSNISLVTIVTVTYNAEEYIEQTIQSILSQKTEEIEYIIVDGNSSDNTLNIIKKHENNIDKIISERDDGIYYAMNKGINLANSQYIAFLNASDWYVDGAIEKIIERLKNNSSIDYLYGDINEYSEDGKYLGLWKGNRGVFRGISIPHPASFIRTSILKEILFDTKYKIAADADLMLKVSRNPKTIMSYLPIQITNFRKGGISSNEKTKSEIEQIHKTYFSNDQIKIIKKDLGNYLFCKINVKEPNFIRFSLGKLSFKLPILNLIYKKVFQQEKEKFNNE
jgi:glycosyltransferase involved in cell wall biosynthesis